MDRIPLTGEEGYVGRFKAQTCPQDGKSIGRIGLNSPGSVQS